MFGSIVDIIADIADVFKTKAGLYLVAGIIIIVILSMLLDGIKKFIRGLDTAILGILVVWLGYQAGQYTTTKQAAPYMYVAGITLFVVGIIIFIIFRAIRRGRKKSAAYNVPDKHAAPEQDI